MEAFTASGVMSSHVSVESAAAVALSAGAALSAGWVGVASAAESPGVPGRLSALGSGSISTYCFQVESSRPASSSAAGSSADPLARAVAAPSWPAVVVGSSACCSCGVSSANPHAANRTSAAVAPLRE